MEVYLIRHTTPDVSPGICYGQSDVGLAATFENEVSEVLNQLPDRIDKVYSSPSYRCTELARKIHSDIILDQRLMEINFGNWEMLPWDAVPADDLNRWMADYITIPPGDGESLQKVCQRVLEAFTDILKGSCEHVAVVTHGGPIRLLINHFNQQELKQAVELKIAYGEVRTLRF